MLPISIGNPLIVAELVNSGFIAAAKAFGDLLLMTTPFYVIIAFLGVPVFLLTRRLALWNLKGCIVSAALVFLPAFLMIYLGDRAPEMSEEIAARMFVGATSGIVIYGLSFWMMVSTSRNR